MNKKLFLKLGLVLTVSVSSLSFVACGQKNDSAKAVNSSKADTRQVETTPQSSVEESGAAISDSENIVETKSENTQQKQQQATQSKKQESKKTTQLKDKEETKQATQLKKQQDSQQKAKEEEKENIKQENKQDTKQKLTEEDYYTIIKEAWQKQKDYVDSIEDPQVKQSLQTPHSAAIFKSSELLLQYPDDSEAISRSVSKVVN